VGEGRADDVELVLDAPDAAMEWADIELALEFAAAKNRVALRVDGLPQFGGEIAAGIEIVVAHYAGEPAEDEIVEAGVVGGRLEPQRPGRLAQADLDRFGGLYRQ